MSDKLTEIDGVGDAIAEQLRDAGFETTVDVRSASIDELSEVKGIGPTTAAACSRPRPTISHCTTRRTTTPGSPARPRSRCGTGDNEPKRAADTPTPGED